MKLLEGTGVALVTPFNEDLSVDFEGLGKLLDHVSPHVDYLVAHGTTGEAATTNAEEKKAIFDFIKSNNKRNLPLVYGIGGNDTASTVSAIRSTDLTGVTALLSVSPYYNKPTQEGIYRHYCALADASPVPVILYNVPGRTMSNMTAATTLRLAEHDNVIGVKEASGDISQCLRIAKGKPDDFLLISGDDILTPAIVAVGGSGLISVLANGLPEIMSEVVAQALNGDYSQSNAANAKLLDINPLLYEESNPVGIKVVLKSRGVCGDMVRLPLIPATGSLTSRINNELKKL